MAFGLFAASLLTLFAGDGGTVAQAAATPCNLTPSAGAAITGIIADPADGPGARIASGFSRLYDENGPRAIPIAGKGLVQDISGLPALRAPGLAIRGVNTGPEGDGAPITTKVIYLPVPKVNYLSAIIRPEDYPKLTALDESVGATGSLYVMAVNGGARQPERLKAAPVLVRIFLSSSGRLKGAGFSAKWAVVNSGAGIGGWQRYGPAEAWLAADAGPQARATAGRNADEDDVAEIH